MLKDATFELRDQIGSIEAKPLLAEVKPRVWDAVFPPDTPVRAPADLDFASRRWRTFRAGEVHDDAKLLHVVAMYADPTSPPAPSVHPGAYPRPRRGTTHTVAMLNVGGKGRRRAYDESEVTAFLDQRIGEGRERISLAALEETIDGMGEDEALLRLALQVHRARRFYERPEAQADYRATPRRNATHRRPPADPDFHERCSLAGGPPGGPTAARSRRRPRRRGPRPPAREPVAGGAHRAGGDETACLETKTRCRWPGNDLVTVPRTEDWPNERLRLGDPDLFGLLDMDPDGSALKVDRFLWTVPRLLDVEANGDPIHAAPTALRSLGFTVVRHRKALDTQDRIGNQASLKGQVTGGRSPLLDTEDVTHGLRVEVWDDTAKAWFTLHARRIDARALEHGRILRDLPEEGFIQGTVATESDGVDDSPVHVHESVFGWEGWSSSAARPGKRVRHENGDEIVEEQDANLDPATPLIVTSEVEPGTLPRLRYGRSYAFRAWAVNLAGTSRAHEIGPAPEPEDAAVASASVALTSSRASRTGALPAADAALRDGGGDPATALHRRERARGGRRRRAHRAGRSVHPGRQVLSRLRNGGPRPSIAEGSCPPSPRIAPPWCLARSATRRSTRRCRSSWTRRCATPRRSPPPAPPLRPTAIPGRWRPSRRSDRSCDGTR